jgi:glycine oxidase
MAFVKADVIIVGAGIVGGAIACELARERMHVLLLDRQKPVAEATWAAAGMLAPAAEAAECPALTPLSRASLDLYPAFVEAIEGETGIRVGLQQNGALLAFFGPEGIRERDESQTELAESGFTCQGLSAEEARRREPQLSPAVVAGLWLCDEASVDNRTLGRAIIVAAQRRGAELRSGVEVSSILVDGRRSVGVMAAGEKITAGHVVIAAGSYSAGIELAGCYAPTRPIRGQMVALDAGMARPASVLRSGRGYLAPREDGRLLAGSTMEVAGFDKSVTPHGLRRILDAAVEMVPQLDAATVLDTWSGLRPDTPDHLPILGPTDIEGLSIATGHFRNGILLAPITARLARQWLLGQTTDLPLDPFSPMRFVARRASGA